MRRTDRIVTAMADKLISHRKVLGIIFVAITVGLLWSATHLKLTPGFLKMIPIKQPYMVTMMKYRKDFSGANQILVSLHWKGKGEIYNRKFMKELEQATQSVFFIPGVDRTTVQSLFTPATIYIKITPQGFNAKRVVPTTYSGTKQQLRDIRNNVEHSGQVGRLVANDQKSALIHADLISYDPDNPNSSQQVNYWQVFKRLQAIRHKYENKDVTVNITGFSMLLGYVINGLMGVFAFFGLAFGITVVLLYLYTRSIKVTGTTVFVATLPVLWLLGVLPLIGYGIDPMSMLVPFLIFSIGVSHAVQMTRTWRLDILQGASAPDAARGAFAKLFIPGTAALLTEALGFAVIMFIKIPIVAELGITACVGVSLMIITNKMILPIILSHMSLEKSSFDHLHKQEGGGFGRWLWQQIAEFARPRRAIGVFLITAVVMAFATWHARSLVIGDSGAGAPELHYNSRYNRDSRAIASSYDIGVNVLGVIFEAPNFSGSSCLHYPVMHEIDQFEVYMRGVAGVQSVKSVAGIGKQIVSAYHEGNPLWQALPRSYDGLETASPASATSLGFATTDCRAVRVMIFTKNHEGPTVAHIVKAVKHFRATHHVKGAKIRLADGNVGVMAATNEAVSNAEVKMLLALFGALVVLSLMTFRSWTASLCVLVPLIGVTVMGNALMAMLNIGLKVSTLPVIALGVGVGVDYGIYLFERIQFHMRDQAADFHDAFLKAMYERGSATVFTAATMSVGVATWVMSALKYQADMGLLLAFLFLVNMFGAIFLLPALGAWLYRGKGARARRSRSADSA